MLMGLEEMDMFPCASLHWPGEVVQALGTAPKNWFYSAWSTRRRTREAHGAEKKIYKFKVFKTSTAVKSLASV